MIIPKSQQKWDREFDNIELKWKLIYIIPAKCCNNTKLHWFQYRILHRILATNDFLYKCKIKQNNLCTFCKTLPETIEHLFWYCELVQAFWDKIEAWVTDNSNYSLIIHKHSAIFGITLNKVFNKPVNYMLMLTKYYIYKCRIHNKPLILKLWQLEVKNFIVTEKMIAIKNNYYDKFVREWGNWLELFDKE